MVRKVAKITPILLAADITSAYTYRDHINYGLLAAIAVPLIVGAAGGFMFTQYFSAEKEIKILVSLAILSLALLRVFMKDRHHSNRDSGKCNTEDDEDAIEGGVGVGSHRVLKNNEMFFLSIIGTLSGFLTAVANIGGPILTFFMLYMDLDTRAVLGTRSLFFAASCFIKIPAHMYLGNLQISDLCDSFGYMLVSMAATRIAETYIVSCVDQIKFEYIALAFTSASALHLLAGSFNQN